MSDKLQIDGNSQEYEAFVEKFKAKHSSDDTFTPKNIYETVRDWAVRRYGIKPGTPIIRPFWPGGDYTTADYPPGCVVIDNPPFSIVKKIVDFYNAHGVRFFIFCPAMSSLAITRDEKTSFVSVGNTITFANGAKVNIGFLTNMGGDILCETASDLHDLLDAVNYDNNKIGKIHVKKYRHAYGVLTSGRLQYLTVHHTPFKVMRKRSSFVRKLDCGTHLFGGGFLIADGDKLAAAERAAAERAEAERAEAHKIELSDREKDLIKQLERGTP